MGGAGWWCVHTCVGQRPTTSDHPGAVNCLMWMLGTELCSLERLASILNLSNYVLVRVSTASINIMAEINLRKKGLSYTS